MRFIPIFLSCLFVAFSAAAASKVQEIKSADGQSAWLIEDHKLPVVTVRIEFENSGSAYDPEGKTGLAYFATHILDEGAGDMDSLAFNRAMEDHAIHFSADAGEDSVSVSLQTLSEFKNKGFDLLALALNKPRFDVEAVERIRASIIAELGQVMEDPTYAASLKWKSLAFAGHAYHNPKIGTPITVAAITREDMKKFHNTHLVCARKIVAVVGDITATEVRDLLAELFPAAKCASHDVAVSDVNPADGAAEPVVISKHVAQTVIHASLPAVTRNDPRYYAMVVLNNILGGNVMLSRLGHEIRDKRGLAYYADSDIGEFDHAAYLSINFATRNAKAKNAVAVFQDELAKIRDNGVTEQELAEAKSYLAGSFPLGLDSQSSLSEYLISIQHFHLGIDYLDKRNSLLYAVTLKQVNELAKTIFSHKPLIVMVGLPDEVPAK